VAGDDVAGHDQRACFRAEVWPLDQDVVLGALRLDGGNGCR